MPGVARGLSTLQSCPAALLVRGGGAAVVPDWVNFCANAAPIASMLIFFAVSVSKNFESKTDTLSLSHTYTHVLSPYMLRLSGVVACLVASHTLPLTKSPRTKRLVPCRYSPIHP